MISMKRTRSHRGTTLVEAMTALAVLGIGVVGFTTAMVGAGAADRRSNARAAAENVAMELAGVMKTWAFNDPRLTPNVSTTWSYSTPDFGSPRSMSGVVPNETFSTGPDYKDASLTSGTCSCSNGVCTGCFGGRTLAQINAAFTQYQFGRYWNVMNDPNSPSNANLKIVSIIVTYTNSGNPSDRGFVTVYTSIFNTQALAPQTL